ncbi:LOW QUALITY PROTEIN: hypothetical protein OSB04_003358, partial [Centaurea solstitialis]
MSREAADFGELQIQESKLKEIPDYVVSNFWGHNDWDFSFVESSGKSGGLLTVWNKNTFRCDFVIKDDNFLAVIGNWDKIEGQVGCVNIYGPGDSNERRNKLDLLCAKDGVNWIFFGDFNEVRGMHERFNSVVCSKGTLEFNDFIGRNELIDIRMGGSKFTRVSDDGVKFSKLDRFLVSNSHGVPWNRLRAKTLERKWSDHTPIILYDLVQDFGPFPFKFFDAWLMDNSLEEEVRKVWGLEVNSTRPDCRFRDKLKNVKASLRAWKTSRWGDVDKDLALAKRRCWVGNKGVVVSTSRKKIEENGWRLERNDFENKKLEIVRQKAKNSKFFHLASRARDRKNAIHGLNINSEWSKDPDTLKKFAVDFFSRKFRARNEPKAKLSMRRLKCLSMEEAESLECKFTEEEVWEAINDCGHNKSPGPDGFTVGFLKKFWSLIKTDLLAVFEWFWDKEDLNVGCNASFLSLIPKVKSPWGLDDFRPISLIGIIYKIISKVLATRLKVVIGSLISDVQSAFVKGRSILDGVLIANEAVDFEKAYDSVDWSFLLEGLESMGFGVKWRNWISACLRSSRISILLNGSPTKEFPMERGLRQGAPLAPFLFLIVAECLHIMVDEAKSKGLFKGVSIGRDNTLITHLQYADDIIFFGTWDTGNFVNLVKISGMFSCGVGLKSQSSFPLLYLGLPVGASMKNSKYWLPVIEKTKRKLANWKAKLISFGGRWTLTRSVLGSREFVGISFGGSEFEWWRGSQERVSLDKVVESNRVFSKGGLNELNLGLLGKWWWRFHEEGGALWVKVIKSLYGNNCGRFKWEGGVKCSIWSNIVKAGVEIDKWGIHFSNSFRKLVGDGSGVKLWEDVWVGKERLKERFSRLYQLEVDKEVSITDRGEFVGEEWRWKLMWRREPRGRECGELEELNSMASSGTSWTLDPGGGFSVREVRRLIEGRGAAARTPCVFRWRGKLERLPVREELAKRGIDLHSTLCPRCDDEVETVPHALIRCREVKTLWRLVEKWWKIDISGCNSLEELIEKGNQPGLCNVSSKRWVAMASCFLYFVWSSRNKLVFGQKIGPLEEEFFRFQQTSFEWARYGNCIGLEKLAIRTEDSNFLKSGLVSLWGCFGSVRGGAVRQCLWWRFRGKR